jgi:NAD(P)H-dependent flavin oxidoreductase YrpB (nitropropane dioxygenase family)
MAFIATVPLARAVCNAGGMGMLGIPAMPPDVLQAAIRDIKAVDPRLLRGRYHCTVQRDRAHRRRFCARNAPERQLRGSCDAVVRLNARTDDACPDGADRPFNRQRRRILPAKHFIDTIVEKSTGAHGYGLGVGGAARSPNYGLLSSSLDARAHRTPVERFVAVTALIASSTCLHVARNCWRPQCCRP